MRGFIRTLNKGGLTLQVASPITLQGLALTKAENAAIITVITLSFLSLGGVYILLKAASSYFNYTSRYKEATLRQVIYISRERNS